MTIHHEPFTSATDLPRDLTIGLWLTCGALLGMAVDELKRWRLVRLP